MDTRRRSCLPIQLAVLRSAKLAASLGIEALPSSHAASRYSCSARRTIEAERTKEPKCVHLLGGRQQRIMSREL